MSLSPSKTPRSAAKLGGSAKKPSSRSPSDPKTAKTESNKGPSPIVFNIPHGYRNLLDAFDAVRRLDKTTDLDLPTLVVSGKTSAGKSSVLEAITGLNFPRASERCTRYATIVSMRREDQVSIRLYTTGSAEDEFGCTLDETNLGDLDDIILHDVANHFGIKSDDEGGNFSDAVLNIDYRGPHLPLLTVVDTPGFVSTENFPEEAALVKKIVHRYINKEKKHTIVLSIIAANDATDNQAILGIMEEIDPEHERTLGVITKPDKDIGNGNVLKLARNEHSKWKMEHKWHVLRNKDTVEHDVDLLSRNEQEKIFFDDEANGWKDFPADQKGIDSLVTRLQLLLQEQTKRAMRPVLSHLRSRLKDLSSKVTDLEAYFANISDRRNEFKVACRNLASIAQFGINGSYKSPYFQRGTNQKRRLRHSVRQATSSFVVEIRGIHGIPKVHEEHQNGNQNQAFIDSGVGTPIGETNSLDLPEWDSESVDNLDKKWREEIMKDLLDKSKGEELPGDADPQRLNLLFWQISEAWKIKAEAHARYVHQMSIEFIHLIIDDWELRPDMEYRFRKPEPDVLVKLKDLIEPTFERHLEAALKELENIEGDRIRASQTTDPMIAEKAQLLRWERNHKTLNSWVQKNSTAKEAEEAANHAGIATFDSEIERKGYDFLDKCLLYYNSALTRYQDNVAVQVVERHILHGLERPLRDIDMIGGDAALDRLLISNSEEKKETLANLKEQQMQFQKCEKKLVAAV